MTIFIKKNTIIFILIVILLVSLLLSFREIKTSITYQNKYTIVIDAGHGGIDGGCVGINSGKDENYLNLQYALTLQKILQKYNFNIVMTRTTLNGLYSQFADNKKIDDMNNRKQIVYDSNADLIISLHMNSFPLTSAKGAQVFYKLDDKPSQVLASSIQDIFLQTLPNARKTASVGDYFMLNEFSIPSVIVECGYLSNPEEEELLISQNYRQLVCYSIFIGILKFLSL